MICLNCGNNLRLILEKKSYRYYKPCSNCFSDIIAQRPNLITNTRKTNFGIKAAAIPTIIKNRQKVKNGTVPK